LIWATLALWQKALQWPTFAAPAKLIGAIDHFVRLKFKAEEVAA
jgi:hypothetical protein